MQSTRHLICTAPTPLLPQVVDHLKKRYGKQAARVLNVVLGSKGGVSGGTIARCAGSWRSWRSADGAAGSAMHCLFHSLSSTRHSTSPPQLPRPRSGMNAFAEMKARPELRGEPNSSDLLPSHECLFEGHQRSVATGPRRCTNFPPSPAHMPHRPTPPAPRRHLTSLPAEDAGSVYSLCPADAKGPDGEFWGVQYSQELGKYLGPFVMQACNNRVVHRSNYLLGWAGQDFRYQVGRCLGGSRCSVQQLCCPTPSQPVVCSPEKLDQRWHLQELHAILSSGMLTSVRTAAVPPLPCRRAWPPSPGWPPSPSSWVSLGDKQEKGAKCVALVTPQPHWLPHSMLLAHTVLRRHAGGGGGHEPDLAAPAAQEGAAGAGRGERAAAGRLGLRRVPSPLQWDRRGVRQPRSAVALS